MPAGLAADAARDQVVERQVLGLGSAQVAGMAPVVEYLPPEPAFALLPWDQFTVDDRVIHDGQHLQGGYSIRQQLGQSRGAGLDDRQGLGLLLPDPLARDA